jgi:predicted DNA-binding protein
MEQVRQLNMRLRHELIERLKLLAAAEGVSLNALIAKVLESWANGQQAEYPVLERLTAIEDRLARLEQHCGVDSGATD